METRRSIGERARPEMSRRRILGLLCAAVVAGSCGSAPPPSAPPPTTASSGFRTFHEGGLAFVYPAGWFEFHYQVVSMFSISIADLATVGVPEPCLGRPGGVGTETVCADRFRLTPNTLVVHVNAAGFPGFDIVRSRPTGATAIVVGGRPAFVQRSPLDYQATGADEVISWTVSRPDTPDNSYQIDAFIRGPDAGRLEDQVQQMIASLQFDQH
jgi:hypothetical protein